jgi:hypothetical protein
LFRFGCKKANFSFLRTLLQNVLSILQNVFLSALFPTPQTEQKHPQHTFISLLSRLLTGLTYEAVCDFEPPIFDGDNMES